MYDNLRYIPVQETMAGNALYELEYLARILRRKEAQELNE
jgi:hypothetical protein